MYAKQSWSDLAAGGTPISAARLNHMEEGIEAAHELAGTGGGEGGSPGQVEAMVLVDGSAGGGDRPAGYFRVRWVGGTTRPLNMATNDVWEHTP